MLQDLLNAIHSGNPVAIVAVLLAMAVVLLSITTHESAHAFTADRLGDPTPRYQGRLTLNPLAHLDPIWTLLILWIGIGMGKPVQFNPLALRTNRFVGSALVAGAGPLTNVILGVVFGLVLRLFFFLGDAIPISPVLFLLVSQTLSIVVILNFGLAIFNMIPFPPLDGSKVLLALLPREMAYSVEAFYYRTQQYGILILMAILFIGSSFIGSLIFGPAQALFDLIVGVS